MTKLKLTMAIGHFDRYIPLFDGTVSPEDIDLNVLAVGQAEKLKHGADRNERMLQNKEFDISETSLSSYLMAKARNVPLTAIPVFPRRQFSQSHIWVNEERRDQRPQRSLGRRVGLNTFQTTLSVSRERRSESEYGVPWRVSVGMCRRKSPSNSSRSTTSAFRLFHAGKKSERCWRRESSTPRSCPVFPNRCFVAQPRSCGFLMIQR